MAISPSACCSHAVAQPTNCTRYILAQVYTLLAAPAALADDASSIMLL